MADTSIIKGMRDRMKQLRHIADMTSNIEIQALVLKVAGEIEAEIKRLEGAPALPLDEQQEMPGPAQI